MGVHTAALAICVVLVAGACGGDAVSHGSQGPVPTLRPAPTPEGPLDPQVRANLQEILSEPLFLTAGNIPDLGDSEDIRVAWILVDLLRFHQAQTQGPALLGALAELTGVRYLPEDGVVPWVAYNDLLLRHDVPAFAGYVDLKRRMYVAVGGRWEPFFDPQADLDWREVTWGGALRDGIPALDDPPVVAGADGDWLPDEDVVFGVEVGGEARAYPRRILEVHELVNDELGGRRIALPYCTLCGAPIPYLADDVPGVDEPLVFGTSGLLQRSNKLMYDQNTESLFEQLLGRAVTGPLREAGVRLERIGVTVTTWGAWRSSHPATTILAEEIDGRVYGAEPLGDRDADGPIFPVGEIDDRLPRQEVVFGVRTPEGTAVAFPVDAARRALRGDRKVEAAGVQLRLEAGGLRASLTDGRDIAGHDAFWFAWIRFHPDTELWRP